MISTVKAKPKQKRKKKNNYISIRNNVKFTISKKKHKTIIKEKKTDNKEKNI